MNRIYKAPIAMAISLTLFACGGGGSEKVVSSVTPPIQTNTAPTVTLENITANENSLVTITAIVSDADNDSLTFSWSQTTGEVISFTNNGPTISFSAPEVNSDTEFTFELSVSDGKLSTSAISTTKVINVLTREEVFQALLTDMNSIRGNIENEMLEVYGNNDGYNNCKNITEPSLLEQCTAPFEANDPDNNYLTYAQVYSSNTDINVGGNNAIMFSFTSYMDHETYTEHDYNNFLVIFNSNTDYTITKMDFASKARDFEVNDFNNDGLDDIYFAGHGYDYHPFPGEQDVLVLQQDDGSFLEVTETNLPSISNFSHGACSGDVFGTGNDILIAMGSQFTYLSNQGQAYFAEAKETLPLDIISSQHVEELGLLKGLPWVPEDNNWDDQLYGASVWGAGYWWCEMADVNNDSYIDIVLGGNANLAHPLNTIYGQNINKKHLILLNDGNGFNKTRVKYVDYTIESTSTDRPEYHTITTELMDMNSDNIPDLITQTTNYFGYTLNFHLNDGEGNFTQIATFQEHDATFIASYSQLDGKFFVRQSDGWGEGQNNRINLIYSYDALQNTIIESTATHNDLAQLSPASFYRTLTQ